MTHSFLPAESAIPHTTEEHTTDLFRRFRGWTFSERSRETASWVWSFGFDIQRDTQRRWVCKLCIIRKHSNIRPITENGLQNAMGHLYTKHRILAPKGKPKSREEKMAFTSKPSPFPSVATFIDLSAEKPAEQAVINKLIKSFDKKHFQRLLIEWLIEENLPFSTIEHYGLRAIFEYLNPQVSIQDANLSRPSIRSRIIKEFYRHQNSVIQALKESPGLKHFAFDGWRAGNRKNVYGIVCFFRHSVDNQPKKIVLGLPELSGRHIGVDIGQAVAKTIDEYQIGDKIGYFILDNAQNNDTAMDFIGNKYGFDGRARRGRCFGHILNLSAKLLLHGNQSEDVTSFIETHEQLTEAEYDLWRKEGPVGKLRILVRAIDSSDRLTALLQDLQRVDITNATGLLGRSKKPLHVVKDNQTRWLGSLYMMRRALRLRPYLEMLKLRFKQEWEEENRSARGTIRRSAEIPTFLEERNWLTNNDWLVIQHFEALLTDYEDTLKLLEGDGQVRRRRGGFVGSYGNVWDVLPAFEFLLGRLEEYVSLANDIPDPVQFKVGVNAAWSKLKDYYKRLDETPIYYASFALHPAKRWSGLEKLWATQSISWMTKAKKMIKDEWNNRYKGLRLDSAISISTPESTPEPLAKRRRVNAFESFLNRTRPDPAAPADDEFEIDELDIWSATTEDDDYSVADPLVYWHQNRRRYPRLSQMALDFLTIQAMSAECERLFSAAGNLLDSTRTSLDIRVVSMCMALRSWLRAGILQEAVDPVLLSVAEEAENTLLEGLTEESARQHVTSWLYTPADSRASTPSHEDDAERAI